MMQEAKSKTGADDNTASNVKLDQAMSDKSSTCSKQDANVTRHSTSATAPGNQGRPTTRPGSWYAAPRSPKLAQAELLRYCHDCGMTVNASTAPSRCPFCGHFKCTWCTDVWGMCHEVCRTCRRISSYKAHSRCRFRSPAEMMLFVLWRRPLILVPTFLRFCNCFIYSKSSC